MFQRLSADMNDARGLELSWRDCTTYVQYDKCWDILGSLRITEGLGAAEVDGGDANVFLVGPSLKRSLDQRALS